ncbi:hypothetical protein [Capnocytophaga sp.]|uniref:hypothetical protein n=1 Tax=Capnocytophaga sp. TaxID=44737 RepID=UPI0026DCFF15|nr:hypothetical protein [Capnocytophaga sp.]MDO5105244.1 hypothetical protein [Capnocytophaga sp.]
MWLNKSKIVKKNRETSLNFIVKELDINSKEYWDEIIQITFISDENYIAISRLSYQDEIYFEFNDQTNFIYAYYKDITFLLEENILSVYILNNIKRSVDVDSIIIDLNNCNLSQITKAIEYLKMNV